MDVFKGRMNRIQFFIYSLLLGIPYLLTIYSPTIFHLKADPTFSFLQNIVYIILVIPSIIIGVRRLHDTNHSGWFMLLSLVPLVDFLLGIYLLLEPGTKGFNQYDKMTVLPPDPTTTPMQPSQPTTV